MSAAINPAPSHLRAVADWAEKNLPEGSRLAVDEQDVDVWPPDLKGALTVVALLTDAQVTYSDSVSFVVSGTCGFGNVDLWVRAEWLALSQKSAGEVFTARHLDGGRA